MTSANPALAIAAALLVLGLGLAFVERFGVHQARGPTPATCVVDNPGDPFFNQTVDDGRLLPICKENLR